MDPYHIKVGLCAVCTNVLHKAGKTLIEPQSVPPCHCHQVTKPLHKHEYNFTNNRERHVDQYRGFQVGRGTCTADGS